MPICRPCKTRPTSNGRNLTPANAEVRADFRFGKFPPKHSAADVPVPPVHATHVGHDIHPAGTGTCGDTETMKQQNRNQNNIMKKHKNENTRMARLNPSKVTTGWQSKRTRA